MDEFRMKDAAKNGDLEKVRSLIKEGVSLVSRDDRGRTPLHWAACKGHTKVVQELLEQEGLDLNSQDEEGETPLHNACSEGHREVVKQLLVAGAETTIRNDAGERALSEAIRLEKLTLEEIRLFVHHDGAVSVGRRNNLGRTLLCWAAAEGHYEVVDFLSGLPECDLNLKDGEGCTPVLLAANCEKKTVVELLLQRGAQVNFADDNKWTLLHSVSANGWTDLVQYILDRGEADLNAADTDGATPLIAAADDGHEEVAALLIQAGAQVNQSVAPKWTALHCAACRGLTKVARLLLEVEGLDLNPQDELGDTPLHLACFKGHREIVKQLLEAGADTTIKNNDGETALGVGIRLEKLTPEDIRLFV